MGGIIYQRNAVIVNKVRVTKIKDHVTERKVTPLFSPFKCIYSISLKYTKRFIVYSYHSEVNWKECELGGT